MMESFHVRSFSSVFTKSIQLKLFTKMPIEQAGGKEAPQAAQGNTLPNDHICVHWIVSGGPVRFLGENILSDAQRHLPAFVQFLDDSVVLRVILKPASCVNDTGQTEP